MDNSQEARILSPEELDRISSKTIIADRFLQRDLHFTFWCHQVASKKLVEFSVTITAGGKSRGTYFSKGLRLSDDNRHLYFFEEWWPCKYDHFLADADATMPSGLQTINRSEEEMERVLKILQNENATLGMVQIPDGDFIKFSNAKGDIKDKIAANTVQVLLDSREMLELALYSSDRRVMDIFSKLPIFFTKPLKRTDGRSVEMFNQLLGTWEKEDGEAKVPNTTLWEKFLGLLKCTQ